MIRAAKSKATKYTTLIEQINLSPAAKWDTNDVLFSAAVEGF